MTPEQIAEQQLVAAWVAAGAAVAQAVGAVAAIWFSVKLAREAERRAGKAERDALAREAAAAARMEQAEREREERRRREDLARQNQAIDAVVSEAGDALVSLDSAVAFYEDQASLGAAGTFLHSVDESAMRQRLQTLVPDLEPKVAEPTLLAAMYRLIKALEPWKPSGSALPAAELLPRLVQHRAMIEKAVEDVRSFHQSS